MGDDRREQILEATYELIGERGLEGLRTRDIAARAKLNISTLHYYFATKEALLIAMVEHTNTKFTTPPPRKRAKAAADEAGLHAHFERAWATFQASPPLATVLQELSLHSQRDETTRAAFRKLHRGWAMVLEYAIQHDIDQGTLRADLDVKTAARVVMSFIMGATMQLGIDDKAFSYTRAAAILEGLLSRR